MIGCCSLRGVLLFSEHVVSTWRAHGERMALFTFVCERVLFVIVVVVVVNCCFVVVVVNCCFVVVIVVFCC